MYTEGPPRSVERARSKSFLESIAVAVASSLVLLAAFGTAAVVHASVDGSPLLALVAAVLAGGSTVVVVTVAGRVTRRTMADLVSRRRPTRRGPAAPERREEARRRTTSSCQSPHADDGSDRDADPTRHSST